MNLLVFREGRRFVSGTALKNALFQQLANSAGQSVLDLLLRAGELECAVTDERSHTKHLAFLTDSLAEALVNHSSAFAFPEVLSQIESTTLPENLSLSAPEGFAYYALHPLAFADVLEKIAPLPAKAVVVGIRSIGLTLSAVTAAALRKRGCNAERMSVRPAGHPYDRHTEFLPQQLDIVSSGITFGADFFIVDEGPGISGSSFLSVAEALVKAGVPREKITLICSYEPHVDRLHAPDGPQRWRQFRWIAAASPPRLPAGAEVYIGGGEWRRCFIGDDSRWPAAWVNFERLKYLSSGSHLSRLFKFLGFGHYGEPVFDLEAKIAAAGFGPPPRMESGGFASYPFIHGRPMLAEDLSESVLARLAAYCAFREQAFRSESADLSALQQMAVHNLQELRFEVPVQLALERPVIADGRMQPHEWLLTADGQMLKTDSGGHGDDHFFPGATDICWDLAGAIVEWKMNAAQREAFLEVYRRASGDDARTRISDFVTAYSIFRCAYCMMAANGLRGTEEQSRLDRAAADYGAMLMDRVIRKSGDRVI